MCNMPGQVTLLLRCLVALFKIRQLDEQVVVEDDLFQVR